MLRDGWIHTGDLATMDEDGYFWIVGRKKDMILVSGYNVYPDEIDRVLASPPGGARGGDHRRSRREAGRDGEVVHRAQAGLQATEDEIVEFCREQLAAYKVPRRSSSARCSRRAPCRRSSAASSSRRRSGKPRNRRSANTARLRTKLSTRQKPRGRAARGPAGRQPRSFAFAQRGHVDRWPTPVNPESTGSPSRRRRRRCISSPSPVRPA